MASSRTAIGNRLRQAARQLDAAHARWALIGGVAVSARSEPRYTRDVDLAVAVADDAEAEHLVHALSRENLVQMTIEHERTGRLATVRLVPRVARERTTFIDLLFASSGIEEEVVAAAESLEVLPRLFAPVATTGHLIALKVLAEDAATRPQDAIDLRELFGVADATELRRAREALKLIRARGYHRGKPLLRRLDAFLRAQRGR